MISSTLSFEWRSRNRAQQFETGVSLHSHTYHSRELLGFIPRFAKPIPGLRTAVQYQADRYKRIHGHDLNFNRGFWTPPLSPRQAFKVEAGQLMERDLRPLVSLTDHNEIEAPSALRGQDGVSPISVEWSVPLTGSFIHLGIHNLPPNRAQTLHLAMQHYRDSLDLEFLDDVLASLDAIPEVLIVFNHPMWDEPKAGAAIHQKMIVDFLDRYRRRIHAFELNGLRPWNENRLVPALAEQYAKPLISGGDRHAGEPNACINLTDKCSFSEFADEIRSGYSEILFLNHYRAPLGSRLMQNMLDVMGDHPGHERGWTRWSDRVFFDCPRDGVRSMSSYWTKGNPPHLVQAFVGLTRLLGHQRLRPAVSLAFGSPQECGG